MKRSNSLRQTLIAIFIGLAALAVWRIAIHQPRPILADEPKTADAAPISQAKERQVLLQEFPKNSAQIFRAQDLKETLELYEGTVCFIDADYNIPRILNESTEVVSVQPITPRRIRVRATQVGTTSISLWNEDDKISTIDISVVIDTRLLARTLKQLYPDLSIEIHDVNGSLLLRGTVHKQEHIAQIVEIGEQYAAKVLNHLVADSRSTKQLEMIQKLKVELIQLRQYLGPTHPQIVERERKIEALQNLAISTDVLKTPEAKVERIQPKATVQKDRPRLLNEVRLLRQDVRRLIELLEDKLDRDGTSNVESPKPDADLPEETEEAKQVDRWSMSLEETLVIGLENSKRLKSLARLTGHDSKNNRISIARTNSDVSLADFETSLSNWTADVESRYWSLWTKHQNLVATMAAHDLVLEIWRGEGARSAEDSPVKGPVRQEYYRLKRACDAALAEVYAEEASLRQVLGLPARDGRIIRPSVDPPTKKVNFDWHKLQAEALEDHPTLRRIKSRIKSVELQLIQAKNNAKPDAVASDTEPSLKLPFGFRAHQAATRDLVLRLEKHRATLKDAELEITHQCSDAIGDLETAFAQLEFADKHCVENDRKLKDVKTQFLEGRTNGTALVEAVASWMDAQTGHSEAVLNYVNSLKNVYRAKGSLLETRHIQLHSEPASDQPVAPELNKGSAQPSRNTVRSVNFVVRAPSTTIARSLSEKAETLRRELSETWLGEKLGDWSQPCPIEVQIGNKLGAGGATTFRFDGGKELAGWNMKIQGPADKIESVLAHEIMHTILATRFNQPLPRWIDEGICLTVESADGQAKMQQMLSQLMEGQRLLPFTELIDETNYPTDVIAMSAQGRSMTKHLVDQGGTRKLIQFIQDAIELDSWSEALEEHYEYETPLAFERAWKSLILSDALTGER